MVVLVEKILPIMVTYTVIRVCPTVGLAVTTRGHINSSVELIDLMMGTVYVIVMANISRTSGIGKPC